MKRLSAQFLLIFFLIANSGLAISFHYCGDDLASVTFFSKEKSTCECGNKAMKKNCCKDETTIIKAKIDNAKINQISFKPSGSNYEIRSIDWIVSVPSVQTQCNKSEHYLPPQFKPKVPIYLLDRVFRI